jgi:phage-related protein (TIGR01555 family)
MSFFDWVRGKREPTPAPVAEVKRQVAAFFEAEGIPRSGPQVREQIEAELTRVVKFHRQYQYEADGQPVLDEKGEQVAMDDGTQSLALKAMPVPPNVSDTQVAWFVQQSFIGYQLCALLSQNWAINRACTLPARDAVRNGFDVVKIDGEKVDPETQLVLRKADKEMRLKPHLQEFIRKGRIFGIRLAYFAIETNDPEYYAKPFDIDSVPEGGYQGIVQVDPYWTAPLLDADAASRPDHPRFYRPTYWLINGRRYHFSHLIVYRHSDPPDLLKPMYLYGGVPVPQQIMQRVFAAERTANETPALVMSKRMSVWLTNLAGLMAAGREGIEKLNFWAFMRDNWGIKIGQKEEDEFQQFETSLADLNDVTMGQYELVAAAAGVPFTKFMGTAPKGFDATGEYDEASYHEDLESLQEHDATPFVERHHQLVLKSAGLEWDGYTVEWRPLDAPTALEVADMNLKKSQTDAQLVATGALDGVDVRNRLRADPSCGYVDLERTPIAPPAPTESGGEEGSGPSRY